MTEREQQLQEIYDHMASDEYKQEQERKELERRLALKNLPRKYWDVSSDYIPDAAPHKELIRKWIRLFQREAKEGNPLPGLYLYGRAATGKTSIAAALLKGFAMQRGGSYFIPYRDLYTYYKERPRDPQAEDDNWEYLHTCRILVVDDFLADYTDNFGKVSKSIFEGLLRHRIGECLSTIVTSNYSLDDITEFVGDERLVSVLVEACYPVHVTGADYRKIVAPKLLEELDV